jgi:nucleoside-diphosphate-sugar epimerase
MMNLEWFADLENTKILIIGGAGFVGSNLTRMIINNVNTVKVTIVDNLLSADIINVPKSDKVKFIEGTIIDFRILANITDEYDYIFHLATYHGNQSSIFDPMKDFENNTLTTLKLYERIKDFKNLKKVVYSSAGCSVAKKTFDDAFATTEESPIELNQDSPYSISKIIGEFYSVYYSKSYHLPVVRARFQNVYGPGEILGAGMWRGTYATVWRNVTPTFIYKAIKGQEIPLENEGIASRDFIYVEDICRGLLLCALNGKYGDVYNIGSGVETTIALMAEKIKELTNSKSEIRYLPKRAWDNSGKRFASTTKSKEVLKFEALVSVEDGLKKTVAWTQENMEIIDECINNHKRHMEAL